MNAEIKMMRTAAETAYSDALSALPAPDAIRALREKALRLFAEKGLPHRRVEEWKYTDLRALIREMPPLAKGADKSAIAEAKKADVLGGIGAREITFVLHRGRQEAEAVEESPQVARAPAGVKHRGSEPRA